MNKKFKVGFLVSVKNHNKWLQNYHFFGDYLVSLQLKIAREMRYESDDRIVMTLDAGGTNFVFSAVQAEKEIVQAFSIPAHAQTLEAVLMNIRRGFELVRQHLPSDPVAISFSFPGPADYEKGIIGDLVNLPVFRGGVALADYLQDVFRVPVFINNDGDLFAYGEAISGFLPQVNQWLEESGSPKRYHNLLGVTFGTGFGAGIVLRGRLLQGDNSAGGEINRISNKLYRNMSVEESVSIRGVRRVYANYANIPFENAPEPREIYQIARGEKPGDSGAAMKAFDEMAVVAGNAIADALTLIDGVVVIGGGLSGAWPIFLDRLVEEMNQAFVTFNGTTTDRLEIKVYNLENPEDKRKFIKGNFHEIKVPFSNRTVIYDTEQRSGVGITRLGTSRAVSLGAYNFALNSLDKER